MDQSKECWYCGKMSSVEQIQLHHAEKRSTSPEKIDDKENLVPLCVEHHLATERSDAFYKLIQRLWKRRSSR